jgi:hypothetical protein
MKKMRASRQLIFQSENNTTFWNSCKLSSQFSTHDTNMFNLLAKADAREVFGDLKCFGVTKQLAESLSRREQLALIRELQHPEITLTSMVALGIDYDPKTVKIGPDPVTVNLLLGFNIKGVSRCYFKKMHRAQRLGLLHELNRATCKPPEGSVLHVANESLMLFDDDSDSEADIEANTEAYPEADTEANTNADVCKKLIILPPGTAGNDVSTLTMPHMCRVLHAFGVKKIVKNSMDRVRRIATIRELMFAARSDEVASMLQRQQDYDGLKRPGETDDAHKRRKVRKARHVGEYVSGLLL